MLAKQKRTSWKLLAESIIFAVSLLAYYILKESWVDHETMD